MTSIASCMTYMNSGEFLQSLKCALDNIFPFQLFYVFLGFVIMGVVFQKTKSYSMSGIIMVLYLMATTTVMDTSFQPYYLLLVGISVMVLLVSIFLGIKRRSY